MPEKSTKPGARRLPSGGPEPWVLGFFLVAGSVLPSRKDMPFRALQGWLGLTEVPRAAQIALLVLISLTVVALLPRRRWPLLVFGVLAWVVRGLWPPLAVASYVAATTYRRPAALVAYGIGASAAAVGPDFVAAGLGALAWNEAVAAVGGAALFVWFPYAIGLWVSARRQVIDGLHESAREQARRHEARAKEVRLEERARIAHDMHDVVAHRVSLMVLHAGALEVNTTDDNAASTAALIRVTGREALAQLRDVLGVLKSGDHAELGRLRPLATLSELDSLLDQSRSAGLLVTRVDEGERRDLPVVVQHAAYRVVQESLTNVHKHAGQVATKVLVRYLPAALEVTVSNAVTGRPPEPLPGGGLGLVGLRERVEVLGGRFDAGPVLGGFAVTARLPSAVSDSAANGLAVSDSEVDGKEPA